MSKVELTRRIHMPRDDVFGLVADSSRWPGFYNNLVRIKGVGSLLNPGDQVGFEYRMLSRLVGSEARLTSVEPPRSLGLEARIIGAVTSRQLWEFDSEGDETLVSVGLEVEDVTDWFGVAIDRYLVARTLQADLSRTLDNLADLVEAGLV